MKALITGGSGFVGQWLARELLSRGVSVDVASVGGSNPSHPTPSILTDDERSRIRWFPADFRVEKDIAGAVATSAPDFVFHLAGIAFPPDADRDPASTYGVNT